jgi:uncharacterized protein YbjT (DUF2867 family)
LRILASDPNVAEVRALVRRPLPKVAKGASIHECRADFDKLDPSSGVFAVDRVFCALGTTIRKAGSQEAFRRVDFGYPLAIARAAGARGACHLLLVSALGADAHSRVFYNRVKGELEEAILALGYPSVTIARPSLLLGDRSERRVGEEFAKKIGWLSPARWAPVKASQVALALVRAAHAGKPGVEVLENIQLRGTA